SGCATAGPWPSSQPPTATSSAASRRPTSMTSCGSWARRDWCAMPTAPRPLALLAELTYRCPLHCPYCSNPLEWGRYRNELDTATWQRVLAEAAQLGVVQGHSSGV